MYKLYNKHQLWLLWIKETLHFTQLLLPFALVIIGISHLPSEYLVQDYTRIYHTEFNAQPYNPQLIMLSWVKCIGIILIVQGVITWRIKSLHIKKETKKYIYWVLISFIVNFALAFVLWNTQADLLIYVTVPAIILASVSFFLYLVYIVLYLILGLR